MPTRGRHEGHVILRVIDDFCSGFDWFDPDICVNNPKCSGRGTDLTSASGTGSQSLKLLQGQFLSLATTTCVVL